MNYLCIGKLVNTHGIKGEVRILSNFRHKGKVFYKGFKLYIGKNKKEYEIENYRVHKNFDMVVFKDNYDINLIEYLKGSLVYINKDDLVLDNNVVLATDLIGYSVLCDNKIIGTVDDVIDNKASEILVLTNDIMIPYVKDFIKDINKDAKQVNIYNIEGLFD